MPQAVLVTGGAGYIGSHASKELARAGYLPIAFDSLERGNRWAVQWGPLEQGNVLDRRRVDEVLEKHRPIAVLHFAAYAYVGESVEEPGKYQRNNVEGSRVLLESLRDHDIRTVVFSSTCATYGLPRETPITETHEQIPINPYGQSKLDVERLLLEHQQASGFRSIALRYFNAAGCDPDGEIGEAHDPETHLIPLALRAALGEADPLQILGTDYDTPDGTCVRDYIHVTDLARAHVLALEQLQCSGKSGAYNLGNGRGFSVREIIDAVCRVTGRPVPVVEADRRAGDPPILVGDASRARDELGWQPRHPGLEEIVRTAWEWERAGGATGSR